MADSNCDETESNHLLDTQRNKSDSSDKEPLFLYISCLVVGFGFFTLGYDIGVISGSMVLITEHFSLTFLWHELLVSLAVGPAIIGSFFAGYASDVLGRKLTLMMSAVVFMAGAIVMACAASADMLLLGRVLTGLAFGFTSISSNIYIAEFAPARIRGKLTTIGSLCVTGSYFMGALISGIFGEDKTNGWRYMLGLGAFPAFMLFAGMLVVPESPRWLISKGRFNEAALVLQKLRGAQDVEEEIYEIRRRHQSAAKEGSTWNVLFRMFQTSSTRKALLIGCGLMAIQQLCGINTILYYTATIIKMSGVEDESTAIWLAAAVAFTNFVFTFGAIFTVERFGRRKLLLTSLVGVFVSLVLLTITFYVEAQTSPSADIILSRRLSTFHECFTSYSCDKCLYDQMCGFCYLQKGSAIQNASCVPLESFSTTSSRYCDKGFELLRYYGCPSRPAVRAMAVFGLVLYFICFSPGLGPVPYVVTSEIYPLWARSAGMACSSATCFFLNLAIAMTFLHGSRFLTKTGWFGLSAGFSFLGWIFVYHFLPETKGKRLEHMEDLFSKS